MNIFLFMNILKKHIIQLISNVKIFFFNSHLSQNSDGMIDPSQICDGILIPSQNSDGNTIPSQFCDRFMTDIY